MEEKKIPSWVKVGIIVLVAILLFFYPLDYYVMKPGSAYDISQYLTVDDGDRDDDGTFNMMTVTMSQATPFMYVYAQLKDYYDLVTIDQVRQEEEDEEEYDIRQHKLMTDSQFNALYNAFSYAKLDYKVTYNGVYVLNILEGGAADGTLQPGDEIVEIDQQVIENQDMLTRLINKKQESDHVELVIKRNNELLTKDIALKTIPNTEGRVGLGITFGESKSITTDPYVTVDAEGIGGPSAGLMFTLEVLNQLMDEDLTKGYQVAGTGAILLDGTVGRIGGVEKKVVAADKAGMEIFFVPDDEVPSDVKAKMPSYQSNAQAAIATAKDIGTTMEIVPVKTLQDAIEYLNTLKPKI